MHDEKPANHGEGNPEAAERFNTDERAFVDSARGKQKIAEGPRVRPDEEAELSKAEQTARDHARDDDSDTKAMNPRQSKN
jgi:hypothetical protein